MAEKNSNLVHAVVAVVVVAALAVSALAIVHLSKQTATTQAATPVAPVTQVIQREVVVPVIAFDTEKLAQAVAEKIEAKTAEKLKTLVAGLVAGADSPIAPSGTRLRSPCVGPNAPLERSIGSADALLIPHVGGRVQRAKVIPATPKMATAPAGSYKTAFGAQPATGSEDAAVLVFIMSDFQCPVCKRAADGLTPMLTEMEGVRWVFWNNPLDMHSRSRAAAAASMAAFRQGKFWEYHDALFADSRALQDADLEQRAKDLGLDMEQFKADIADKALDFQFDRNMRVAEMLGARGTPSFIINGRKQVGWGSAVGIRSMVQREVDASRELLASGKTVAQVREARARENAKTPEELDAYLAHMMRGEVPPTAE